MGATGRSCWDVDENGACDTSSEDTDGDGACTTADCRGLTGPSGVVEVLDFDTFASNLALGGLVRRQCMTPSYTAGADEVAVINMHATAQAPNADAGNFLIAAVAVSSDGGATFPPADRSTDHFAIYVGTGLGAIAHVSASHRVDLVEGSSYVFGWALGGGTSMAGVTCSGVATISRLP
jgi:opacity protein-like surface antigen